MFGKKRRDDTQRLFDTFMTTRVKGTPFAFSAGDVVVLTTNGVVYRDLISGVRFKNAKCKVSGLPQVEIVEHKGLGLGKHEISKDIVLRDTLKNALLFGSVETKEPGKNEFTGGTSTLIISSTPGSLKSFVEGVVRQHVLEYEINVAPKEKWETSWYPGLFTMMSINNRLVYESSFFEKPESQDDVSCKLVREIDALTKCVPELAQVEMGEE